MVNGNCHVGASNKARLDAHERRLEDLTKAIEDTLKHFESSQQVLVGRMDDLHREFTQRLDRIVERFGNRPSWVTMLVLTGLSSLSVGLIVYLVSMGG